MIKSQHINMLGHGVSEPIGLEYIQASVTSNNLNAYLLNRFELEVSGSGLASEVSLFSSTSPEWETVLALNAEAKKRGNITVIGGYHVTGLYRSSILNSIPFNYAVIGEGEAAIFNVLKDILSNKEFLNKTKQTKIFVSNPIQDIDLLPIPERHESYLSNYKILDLMYPAPSNQINTAIVLGSRGCNGNCSFCASSSMWGSKVRLRNPDKIIEEIKMLKKRFHTNTIVFIDQCFGVNVKWNEELCMQIIKEKLGVNWYIQTNVNIDPKLIPLMAEAGCSKIGFGVESLVSEQLAKLKSGHIKSLEGINDLLRYCNKNGVLTKAYLMVGFPWETKEYIESYLHNISSLEANCIKISFFVPFPGTQDWELYKNQLVTTDWSDFDTVKMPVARNLYISVEQYLQYRELLFHNFYSSQQYKKVTLELLIDYPKFIQSFEDFFQFLKHYMMLPMNIELNDWLSLTQNTII
jgi:anaerobic magnesium-protoporphyrin IX monomethyl ester cyclase